jgi:hypothetical protein
MAAMELLETTKMLLQLGTEVCCRHTDYPPKSYVLLIQIFIKNKPDSFDPVLF